MLTMSVTGLAYYAMIAQTPTNCDCTCAQM